VHVESHNVLYIYMVINCRPEKLFDGDSKGLHNTSHLLSCGRERTYLSEEEETADTLFSPPQMTSEELKHFQNIVEKYG
jgi:hypothetical protein